MILPKFPFINKTNFDDYNILNLNVQTYETYEVKQVLFFDPLHISSFNVYTLHSVTKWIFLLISMHTFDMLEPDSYSICYRYIVLIQQVLVV